jgi:hypothetical protein
MMDVVRLTLMVPHPEVGKIVRKIRDKREEYDRKVAQINSGSYQGEKLTSAEAKREKIESLPKLDLELELTQLAESKAQDPMKVMFEHGLDIRKYVKKLQFRVETAASLDVLADAKIQPQPALVDLYKFRMRAEASFDPAITSAIEQLIVAVSIADRGGSIDASRETRMREDIKPLHFAGFFKTFQVQLGLGTVRNLVETGARALGLDVNDAIPGGAFSAQWIKNIITDEIEEKKQFFVLLTLLPWKYAAQWFLDSQTAYLGGGSRQSRRYGDAMAGLTAVKVISTILAQDIDEIGAFHARHATGIGLSLTLDRYLPFPPLTQLLEGFKPKPPTI